MIYLDNNASTVLYPQAIVAATDCLIHNANSGTQHAMGREAKKRLELCRDSVAKLLNVSPEQVLFTSGATEANNVALMGGGEKTALVSAMEHPSILNVHPNTQIIPVDSFGVVDIEWIENKLKTFQSGEVVISVMFASHETGVLQPVEKIAQLAKKYSQRYHLDAVQGAGKTNIDFNDLGVDSLSIAAHKMGGAQGIGALISKQGLKLDSLIKGGLQEMGKRPGTPNISGAASLQAAAQVCMQTMNVKSERLNRLREKFETEITTRNQQVIVASSGADRLVGTTTLILPEVKSDKQVMFMDQKEIYVSAGAACSAGIIKDNRSLKAMGYAPHHSQCGIRICMGWNTTDEDIEQFIAAYNEMAQKLSK